MHVHSTRTIYGIVFPVNGLEEWIINSLAFLFLCLLLIIKMNLKSGTG